VAVKRRKCSRCGVNRHPKFFVSDRGRVCSQCRRTRTRSASKDQRLQQEYGITLGEWNAILDAQGGVCAICEGTRSSFDTDHDHQIERALVAQGVAPLMARRMSIRGLLCKRCNRRLLPAAQDSEGRLLAAIHYLDNWPAFDVLGPFEAVT
jgi:hypothetical protein